VQSLGTCLHGTITATGWSTCGLATYSGGSGTLNDGVIGVSGGDTQLFLASVGPIITLHLSGMVSLNNAEVHGGNFPESIIPGKLDGATFGFGGASVTLGSTPFGGDPNDRFSCADTALEGMAGNTLTISNVTGPLFDSSFTITEITLDGDSAVPEPATCLFLGTGLAMLVAFARLRRAR